MCSPSSQRVPTSITTYARKCRSELCRNCVRSPRNGGQIPAFTGSHREAFCGGKSLNRLRKGVFRYHSVSVAGFVFQACSFNHSDISPHLWNQRVAGDLKQSIAKRCFKSCCSAMRFGFSGLRAGLNLSSRKLCQTSSYCPITYGVSTGSRTTRIHARAVLR